MGAGRGAIEVSGRMTHDPAAPSRALSRGRRGWGALAAARWPLLSSAELLGTQMQLVLGFQGSSGRCWSPAAVGSLPSGDGGIPCLWPVWAVLLNWERVGLRAIDGHFPWERGAKAFLPRGGCSPRGRAGERAGGALGPRASRAGLLGEAERCLLPWVPGDFIFWPYVKV